MPAASGTREVTFCPQCYAPQPRGTTCGCRDAGVPEAEIEGYRVAVDAPPDRVLTDRTTRMVPAMAAAGVVALLALVAAIIS